MTCGSVIETRAMYGDLVVMIDVAAFMMIIGILASVATGATASALGVSTKPARKSHLVARDQLLRQALGDVGRGPARVLLDELDLLAGDGVAVRLDVRLGAVGDLLAYAANGPENSRIRPTLIVPGASAGVVANAQAAATTIPYDHFLTFISTLLRRRAFSRMQADRATARRLRRRASPLEIGGGLASLRDPGNPGRAPSPWCIRCAIRANVRSPDATSIAARLAGVSDQWPIAKGGYGRRYWAP